MNGLITQAKVLEETIREALWQRGLIEEFVGPDNGGPFDHTEVSLLLDQASRVHSAAAHLSDAFNAVAEGESEDATPKKVRREPEDVLMKSALQALDRLDAAQRALFAAAARAELLQEGKLVDKYKTIAAQMRRMRIAAGFTMEELAESIDTTKSVINHVENSRRTTTLDILTRWADACGFRIEFSTSRKQLTGWSPDQLAMYAGHAGRAITHALTKIARTVSVGRVTDEDANTLVSLVEDALDTSMMTMRVAAHVNHIAQRDNPANPEAARRGLWQTMYEHIEDMHMAPEIPF